MTSRATEIQTLIADIDNLLAKGKRPFALIPNQAQEPRQLLERLRNFLVSLAETEAEVGGALISSSEGQLSPLVARYVDQSNSPSSPQQNQLNQSVRDSQQQSTFSELLQPLQAELQTLLQERANLVQEIKQLEQKRLHNYSLAQQMASQEQMIAEFLQVLTTRITRLFATNNGETAPSSSPEQSEQLTRLNSELDRRLLALDGTVNVVFEALQRNIHTYHESLSQALARMHNKSVQGEQLLSSLIDNLASVLPQQTASPELHKTEVQKETLSYSPASAVGTNTVEQQALQPVESTKPESQSLQVPQLDTSSPPTDDSNQINTINHQNSQIQDTTSTPDFDAVLLQLEQEPAQASVLPDEVDQLYASLFTSEDLTDSILEVTSTEVIFEAPNLPNLTDEFSVPASPEPSVLDTPDTTPATQQEDSAVVDTTPATNQVQQEDSAVVMPDPWLSQANTQDPLLQVTEQLADLANKFTLTEDTAVDTEQPASANTITTLSQLLTDVGTIEELPKAPEKPVETTQAKTPTVNSDVQHLLDNFIPASPQENLLGQEESYATTPVPDITLVQNQLQQLDLDLANFEPIENQLQPIINLENQPKAENTDAAVELLEVPSVESTGLEAVNSVDSVTQAPIAETEKKNQPTTQINTSSLAISDSTNNPERFLVGNSVWYLGIDLGTTGISAALLNRSTTQMYPLYWSAQAHGEGNSLARTFRLPAEVYLPKASLSKEAQQTAPGVTEDSVLPASPPADNLYSAQLKPYLQVAIPYKSNQKWEPVLELNEFSTVPLVWVVRSLSKLLLTLKSNPTSTTPGLTAATVGIDSDTFAAIINNITGVICTCPSNWSEQYRFNVREALVTSKLVQHPQQVFFVEEAIASLLSELDGANGEIVTLTSRQGSRPAKTSDCPRGSAKGNRNLLGSTLVMNIGASLTEMALVDLPENLLELAYSDFMLYNFAYAGKSIEQDIICQLLLPPKWRQPRTSTESETKNNTSNPWHWQPAIPGLDGMSLSSLNLSEFNLPRPGEPDITERIRLQQRLESSLVGKAVLEAAVALKLILQHQDSFTLEFADQRWVLQRRDLENQVFVPFVRRLNRELNKLLVARGIPTEAINQAILTGGTATLGAVSRWLRQKLPNAKIIQDLYLGDNGAPTCSRVAYGLCLLPLHPQVLEVPRQQYTDYFLFTELLRVLPDRPLSFTEVIQLFEARGINTRSCQQRLLAFMEGELPSGLIPNSVDSTWLSHRSRENPDYVAIASAPLFEKQGGVTYRPNSQQLNHVQRLLDAIKASTGQSLEEPYTVNFALGVPN